MLAGTVAGDVVPVLVGEGTPVVGVFVVVPVEDPPAKRLAIWVRKLRSEPCWAEVSALKTWKSWTSWAWEKPGCPVFVAVAGLAGVPELRFLNQANPPMPAAIAPIQTTSGMPAGRFIPAPAGWASSARRAASASTGGRRSCGLAWPPAEGPCGPERADGLDGVDELGEGQRAGTARAGRGR